jgi:hypothetical protein
MQCILFMHATGLPIGVNHDTLLAKGLQIVVSPNEDQGL